MILDGVFIILLGYLLYESWKLKERIKGLSNAVGGFSKFIDERKGNKGQVKRDKPGAIKVVNPTSKTNKGRK